MMSEAHFCGLATQSSIFGLTSLSTGVGSHKILMASSKRKVYCVEYCQNNNCLLPSTREVQFTYIPGGAEIISIDAFNQASHKHDFVVGITFIKCDSSGKRSQYFNIYSDWEPSCECDLDNIAQGCLSLGLDFIPIQLTHTEVLVRESKEIAWLLSGNDCKIHLYREDKSRQSFCEDVTAEHFPEFRHLPSIVLWMDFITQQNARVTAFGCENGAVFVNLVSIAPDVKIMSTWSIEHDGPISAVRLFCDESSLPFRKANGEKTVDPCVHLVVGNSLEVSVVYRDILKKGLTLASQWLLPFSNSYDVVTCVCLADIDMDGHHEIMLGTYGQQLLIYKWNSQSQDGKGSFVLLHEQAFPNPILCLTYIDITGDGLRELLILSTKGLHIFQHNLWKTTEKCIERLGLLLKSRKF